MESVICTLIVYFTIFISQSFKVQCGDLCFTFGRINCRRNKVIKTVSVEYYTERNCEGSRRIQSTCDVPNDGINSEFLTQKCLDKRICGFVVSKCQSSEQLYKSTMISYECTDQSKEACVSFGHLDCGDEILHVENVDYYSDRGCKNDQVSIHSCENNANAITLSRLEETCNGRHSCDFRIVRCLTSGRLKKSTNIEYSCKTGTTPVIIPTERTVDISSSPISTENTRTTKRTTAIYGSSTTTKSNDTVTAGFQTEKDSDPGNTGAVVGGVIGALCAVIVVIVVAVICIRKWRCLVNREDGLKSLFKSKREILDYEQPVQNYDIPKRNGETTTTMHELDGDKSTHYSVLTSARMADSFGENIPTNEDISYTTAYEAVEDVRGTKNPDYEIARSQSGDMDNYFVLEGEKGTEDPNSTSADIDLLFKITSERAVGEQSPSKTCDSFPVATPTEYSLAVPVVGAESDNYYSIAEGQKDVDGVSATQNAQLKRDSCGYSHMADFKRRADVRDSTYDHASTTIVGNEDQYGYAHTDNGMQGEHVSRNHNRKARRIVDSEYSVSVDPKEIEYQNLTKD